jgi:hypothetical protein
VTSVRNVREVATTAPYRTKDPGAGGGDPGAAATAEPGCANADPAAPRVRSHCCFRKKGTEYVSDSGINWMSR